MQVRVYDVEDFVDDRVPNLPIWKPLVVDSDGVRPEIDLAPQGYTFVHIDVYGTVLVLDAVGFSKNVSFCWLQKSPPYILRYHHRILRL